MNLHSILSRLPFWAYRPLLKRRVSGFFLHDVSEEPAAIIRNLFRAPSPDELREILAFLVGEFNFVSLEEVARHYREGVPLPPKAAFFSIDDGYTSCRRVIAPMLKEAGIPATFFLTTCAINNAGMFGAHKRSLIIDELLRNRDERERIPFSPPDGEGTEWLPARDLAKIMRRFPIHTEKGQESLERLGRDLGIDWQAYLDERRPFMCDDDIRWLLDQGFEIGAHGVDHTKFQFLDEAARAKQLRESVDFLCDRFGVQRVAFSFPNSAARVSREWMRDQLDANSRISIFVNTGGYQANDAVMVNRLTLDLPLHGKGGPATPGPETVVNAIRASFARHAFQN